MKLSPEVEGIDKARMLLKNLAANPPETGVSLGLPMRICRDLYAEIREAKARGHTWPAIREAIFKGTGVKMAVSTLNRNFYIIDEKWAKETGVPMLPKTGNNPWGGKGKKRKEAAA